MACVFTLLFLRKISRAHPQTTSPESRPTESSLPRPVPLSLAADDLVPYGCDDGCTTSHHNPHKTTVEVCYPWHPLFGMNLTCAGTLRRSEGEVLLIVKSDQTPLGLRSVPTWMCDAGTCASMKLCEQPSVPILQLRMLQRLLAIPHDDQPSALLEHQHTSESSDQGGAHVDQTQDPPHATGLVSTTNSASSVSGTSSSCPTGDDQVDCQAVDARVERSRQQGGKS